MWWFSPVPAVFKLDSLAAQACGTAPRASRALRVADTTALRAALDPRASAVPSDRLAGRPVACPGAVRRKGIGASRPIYPPTDVSVGPLFERGLIEIREPHNGIWAEAPPMTRAHVAAALDDRDTWISYADRDNRMVMVMSTDRWEELVRGNRVSEARQDSTS